jgi:hypothetical protein
MKGLNKPPSPKRIPLAQWRPAPRKMGQSLVNVNPNVNVTAPVNVPINIDLGRLPLSVGLFAGSVVAFVVKGQLPKGAWRTASMVGGVGLAIAGVGNLFVKKPAAAVQTVVPRGSQPPVSTTDFRGNPVTSQVVNVASQRSFDSVTGRILTPTDFSTVDLWSWQGSYPVKIQFNNPSSDTVDFTLELTGAESPAPFGDETSASYAQQVSIGPGETKNVDVSMPTATWGFSKTYVDIVLTAKKRRAAPDEPAMLDFKSFVIS